MFCVRAHNVSPGSGASPMKNITGSPKTFAPSMGSSPPLSVSIVLRQAIDQDVSFWVSEREENREKRERLTRSTRILSQQSPVFPCLPSTRPIRNYLPFLALWSSRQVIPRKPSNPRTYDSFSGNLPSSPDPPISLFPLDSLCKLVERRKEEPRASG